MRGGVRNLFYNGFRSVFPWTALLVFGMWLGRRDLANSMLRRRVFVISASLAVLAEMISAVLIRVFRADPRGVADADIVAVFGTVSMPPLPMFLMAAGSTAVAVICLSLTIAAKFPSLMVVRSLVACGQMALTWYIGHIVLGLGGLESLGLEGTQTLAVSVMAAAAFFAAISLISLVARSRGRRGPLEWLMRVVAG